MEEKDVAPSPDWDPARSSVSRGLQSSGTSSSNLSGLKTISDSLRTGWYSNDKPDVEIYPNETSKCAQLVRTLQHTERLQSALQTAVDTLQRHSKWFTQDGLEALLQHALLKASESKSTADLEVTLELISAAITFAALPQSCLQPVVKFIALAYCIGSRMNKHKGLATRAWDLYQHILQSHLGPSSILALLDILDTEETQWARSSFTAVSGGLRLLEEKFTFGGSSNATTHTIGVSELLLDLRSIVNNGDDILKEQIIAVLHKCITNDATIAEMHALACWATLIELVERCNITSDDAVAQAFLDRLADVCDHFEAPQLQSVSAVFIRASHSLPKAVTEHLIAPTKVVRRLLTTPTTYDQLVAAFSLDAIYSDELQAIAKNDLDLLVLCEDRNDWVQLTKKYMKSASSKSLPKETAIICAALICSLFHTAFETSSVQARLWKITLSFDAITKLAVSAPHPEARLCALRALSRLRVTINGHVYIEEDDSTSGVIAAGTAPGCVILEDLPRKMWLDEVLMLIREPDAENNQITSAAVLTSLPAQLNNLLFFIDQKEHVRSIYEIAIQKLNSTDTSKAAYYIRILTALVNYHGLFSPSEERHIVDLFIKKAGSSEVVSKDCIHALTLCCHEIPATIARELDNVVQKMAQMITQKHLTIHVLEFLTGLSRLPTLFRNFRSDDFRKIFGVCMSYLQSLRDGHLSRQTVVSSDTGSGSQTTHEILPHYVYALAHHVMIFWYLALRPDDRHIIRQYVTNGLCYKREGDKDMPDDQGMVVIDFMDRIDGETTALTGPKTLTDGDVEDVFDDVDGKILTQHRMCGVVLVSTHTSLRTAKTLVTTRRPSGTARYLVFGRNPIVQESWTSTYISAAPPSVWSGSEDETLTIYSDDPDGSSYGAIAVPNSSSPLGSAEVIVLPEEPALDRAIQVFDRTPGLDSHKAGVVYIGEGQDNEDDILANSSGSPDYKDIVENLGTLQELKGAKFNTQGLDTRDGTDGKHAIVWNDQITELVFHVTTLMPTDITEKHMSAVRKKAHIGNDHVNIIFNNSGLPFRFDTFPSQFNYVYIVITPSVRTTFLQTRTHTMNTSDRNRFYKVEVMTRDDFPAISSAAEPKMISGASLPGYIRNLALNACVFSEVWVNRDMEEYRSSWQTRLNQIKRLRERYAPVSTGPPVANKGKTKSTFWK